MYIAIAIAAALVLTLAVLLFLRRRRQRRDSAPISIVMLRNSPRNFSEADIRATFQRVNNRELQIQKISPHPSTDAYLVMAEGLPPLAVLDSRRQYAPPEDLALTSLHSEHPVLRDALLNHTAWVSIDVMGVNSASVSRQDRAVIYGVLGRIAAELVDDRCMLLYLPAEERVAEPGPEAERRLREGKIAELFGDHELHAQMFLTTKEDEAINAAIKEAQTRLPEFCAAFERLGAACEGLFKARFRIGGEDSGSNEYIWCKAESLAAAGFTGVVLNHAVDPNVPGKDTIVTVKLDDIVDWMYIDESKKAHGMFVERVLMSRKR